MSPPVLSPAGAAFIGAFEGFRASCYDDGGRPGLGNCTIGYGHLVHYGPTTQADRQRWGTIDRRHAALLLQVDARHALAAVAEHIRVQLAQHELDALCSLAYNCGPAVLAGHVGEVYNRRPPRGQVARSLAGERWRGELERAMVAWDHAGGKELPGLRRRRLAEWVLALQGRYTLATGNPYANS